MRVDQRHLDCAGGRTGANGRAVLAEPRGAGGDAAVPGVPAPRVPGAGVGVERPGGPAPVPQDDGRLAGAGRPHRLHAAAGGEDRPLREPPEEVVPGRPALLRHRGRSTAATRRACWSRATWAGPPRSRATPSTRPAWAPPTSSARPPSSTSTIPTARRPSPTWARSGAWSAFLAAMRSAVEAQRPCGGAGLRILTETVTSPTLAKQLERPAGGVPGRQVAPVGARRRDNVRAGTMLAFGEPLEVRYHLDKADVVLTLDADFVGSGPGRLRAHPRVHGAPPAGRAARPAEPALRGREHAHADRRPGRPSPGGEASRGRGPRPRAGTRWWASARPRAAPRPTPSGSGRWRATWQRTWARRS